MSDSPEPIQGDLADSIAMLEQILEVMPQDVEALKALYNACLQGGHNDEAFGYLKRLAAVVADGGNSDALAYVQNELPRFEVEYPSEVSEQIVKLRATAGIALGKPAVRKVGEDIPEEPVAAVKAEIDISEELALAWKLYEEGQLSQEEYSSVLHDLTEVSSKEVEVPVSVLHVLNDRGFTQMSRVMNYLSGRSGVPFLSLSNFELSDDVAKTLPLETSVHGGALPFAFMGNDLLIGVLNPFNHALLEKVEAESGHSCHTYLVEPDDYDLALGKLKKLVGDNG